MAKFAWGGCPEPGISGNVGNLLINDLKVDAFFALGDMPYIPYTYNTQPAAGAGTGLPNPVWGVPTATINISATLNDFKAHYTQFFANPSIARIQAGCDYYSMWGDHELPGNDWDHTVTQANDVYSSGASTQAHVNALFNKGREAFQWAMDTWSNNAAGIPLTTNGQIPRLPNVAGAAHTVSDYVPLGFSVGYDGAGNVDNTNPLIEFFLLDQNTCSEALNLTTAPDTGTYPTHDKRRCGNEQIDALITRMLASTATYKVVTVSMGMAATGVYDATWGVEYDYLVAQLDTIPETVIVLNSDAHACYMYQLNGADIYGFECSNLNQMVASRMSWPSGIVENPPAIIQGSIDEAFVGVIEADTDKMVVSLRSSHDGRVFHSVTFFPGSSLPVQFGTVAVSSEK